MGSNPILLTKNKIMQNKKQSLIEAFTNTAIGLVMSFVISIIAYPLLGIKVTLGENLILTAMFCLRRLFSKIFNKKK